MDNKEVELTLASDVEVVLSRTVNAPRELVFDAWTNPEHLPNWMLGPPGWTMPVCERDNRAGGSHRTVWRKGDGAEMEIAGTVREFDPPSRYVATESWGPGWPETVNTITFTDSDGRTLVEVSILYPSQEARDAALRTPMKEGMEQGFARLDDYLPTIG